MSSCVRRDAYTTPYEVFVHPGLCGAVGRGFRLSSRSLSVQPAGADIQRARERSSADIRACEQPALDACTYTRSYAFYAAALRASVSSARHASASKRHRVGSSGGGRDTRRPHIGSASGARQGESPHLHAALRP
jgi:hypothetical protein